MKNSVYKHIELTGTSATSIEDAVAHAITRAHKTIKDLCWFQVVETRGDQRDLPLAVGIAVKKPVAAQAAAGHTFDHRCFRQGISAGWLTVVAKKSFVRAK